MSRKQEVNQTFPREALINKYGFLYLGKDVLAVVGFQRGEKVKVMLRQTSEGLLVTKADRNEVKG